MTRNELARAIYDTSHLTGDFLLRSGKTSTEYFDKYLFESQPELLAEIARHLKSLLPAEFDILAGLEMGGIPVVTALSFASNSPATFVRKKPKDYGTCKFAEGASVNGKRVVVVEDVVTSGGQVVLSTSDLRSDGAVIDVCLCVIDREQGGRESLSEIGVELRSLFTMAELKSAVDSIGE